MKFEEAGAPIGVPLTAEGVSERTFRRWRVRYEGTPTVSTTAAWAATMDRGCWSCSMGPRIHEKLWPITASSAATTGCGELASPCPGVGRTGASGRAVPCPDVAPTAQPRVGPRSNPIVTMDEAARRRGHHVELRGGVRGDPGQGPGSTPTAPATTGTRPRPAARWTRHPDPGRPRPGDHFYSPEARGRRSACSAPCRSACPRNRHHRQKLKEVALISVPRTGLRPLHRRARRHPVHPRGTHRSRQHGALQAPGTSDPRRPPPLLGQGPRPRIPRRHEWPSSMDRDVWRA